MNIPSKRLEGIESLRAYAAFAIIFFHLAGVGKVNVPSSIEFIKSHFGFGVPLFYVVSAFSMAYGYWGKLSSEDDLNDYFVRRLTRIAPLFYSMLIFQILHLWIAYGVTFSAGEIFLNAVFLFNLIPHLTDGIVPASWSIGVEMIFYAIFPMVILLGKTLFRSLFLLFISIVMATYFSIDMKLVEGNFSGFSYHNFIINFPYFCWGLLGFYFFKIANNIKDTKNRKLFARISCVIAIALMVTLYKYFDLYMFFWGRGLRTTWDTLWGMPFALLCIGLAVYPTRILSNPFTRLMGKISFSLYLVQPTAIYYLEKIGFYDSVISIFTGKTWLGFFVCAVITVAIIALISFATYRYIERPGMLLGQRLTKRNSLNKLLPKSD